ncbi:ribonuclease toxin immunity protein CdiI [Glaesserella parasuis]|nr:ribonuclease toxin immunity protein CdiI [Glaesserella parasuis]MDP0272340.1 ribonuclease toxin immunity protein CdiI [Glaesserella parasuis]MDP0306148.1 ribonuclease toxin immunity protein CdiI [Glaesserella parasuis]MDP0470853.1 ribonuclease toxin immunity protein CdiI [Glaesserella parasuis]
MFTLNSSIPIYQPLGHPFEPILSIDFENTNEELIVGGYMDSTYYSGNFLNAIYYVLVERDGFCEEGADCYYTDPNSPFPEDHFEGIRFEIGGLCDPRYQVHVSERKGFMYFRQACLNFLELHHEDIYKVFLFEILDNWKPSL